MTDRGFVYAATGRDFVTLARRSARALRRVHPEAEIDLFCDEDLEDPVFNRVHRLERVSRRPKMEALLRSRFERTLYMDADTMVVAPVEDMFDVLDQFDIALTAEQRRNDDRSVAQLPEAPVPVAFPVMNGGLIALRRNARTTRFITDWQTWVHERQQKFDQPSLRALLYRSDLRMHVLPPEYNVMFFGPFMRLGPAFTAPRILHQPLLHQNPVGDPTTPLGVGDMLTEPQIVQLNQLLCTDQTLPYFRALLAAGGASKMASVLPDWLQPTPEAGRNLKLPSPWRVRLRDWLRSPI